MNNDMTELSRVSLEEIFLDDPEARAEFERDFDKEQHKHSHD